jgi:hypothetical protein
MISKILATGVEERSIVRPKNNQEVLWINHLSILKCVEVQK